MTPPTRAPPLPIQAPPRAPPLPRLHPTRVGTSGPAYPAPPRAPPKLRPRPSKFRPDPGHTLSSPGSTSPQALRLPGSSLSYRGPAPQIQACLEMEAPGSDNLWPGGHWEAGRGLPPSGKRAGQACDGPRAGPTACANALATSEQRPCPCALVRPTE